MHEITGTDTVFEDHSVSKETINALASAWIAMCARVDCVCKCGSLTCICGLCARVWISRVHLWIVCASVDLSRAFVDCVCECGSLTCICGLCVRVWISRVHLWIALWIFAVYLWIVCTSVDLSRAFVDCVHECAFVGGFDTVYV